MALIKKQDKEQNEKKTAPKGEAAVAGKESSKKVLTRGVKKQAVVKKDTVNRFEEIKKYFRGVISELKKVHWPTRQEVLTYTGVVVVAVIIVGALIWIFDSLMSRLIQLIIR
ncbi:MAG: preprotein translocase subunit SecE [Desulfocucumaceae bacterium]